MAAARLAVVFVLGLATAAAAQVFREPLMVQRPIDVLAAPEAPIELRSAQLQAPGIVLATLGVARLEDLVNREITLRLGARLSATRMLTYRMRPVMPFRTSTSRGIPDLLLERGVPMSFQPIPEDGNPSPLTIRRDTVVVVTIEQIAEADGQLVYEHAASLERLFDAVQNVR